MSIILRQIICYQAFMLSILSFTIKHLLTYSFILTFHVFVNLKMDALCNAEMMAIVACKLLMSNNFWGEKEGKRAQNGYKYMYLTFMHGSNSY